MSAHRRSLTPPAMMPSSVIEAGEEYRHDAGYIKWWYSQKGKPARLLPPVLTKENVRKVVEMNEGGVVSVSVTTSVCDSVGGGTPRSYSSEEDSTSTWEEPVKEQPAPCPVEQFFPEPEAPPMPPVYDVWGCACGMINHVSFPYCQGCSLYYSPEY